MEILNRKKIISIGVFIILLIGLIVGVVLVQRQQIFKSRASLQAYNAFNVASGEAGKYVNCSGNVCETNTLNITMSVRDLTALEVKEEVASAAKTPEQCRQELGTPGPICDLGSCIKNEVVVKDNECSFEPKTVDLSFCPNNCQPNGSQTILCREAETCQKYSNSGQLTGKLIKYWVNDLGGTDGCQSTQESDDTDKCPTGQTLPPGQYTSAGGGLTGQTSTGLLAPAFCSAQDYSTACWQGSQCKEENQGNADKACSNNHGQGSKCTRSTGQPDVFEDGCTTPPAISSADINKCSAQYYATACWQGADCKEENQASADSTCNQNHGFGSQCTRSTGQSNIHEDGCTFGTNDQAGASAKANCTSEAYATTCWQGARCDETNQQNADYTCSNNHGPGSKCTRSTGLAGTSDDGCTVTVLDIAKVRQALQTAAAPVPDCKDIYSCSEDITAELIIEDSCGEKASRSVVDPKSCAPELDYDQALDLHFESKRLAKLKQQQEEQKKEKPFWEKAGDVAGGLWNGIISLGKGVQEAPTLGEINQGNAQVLAKNIQSFLGQTQRGIEIFSNMTPECQGVVIQENFEHRPVEEKLRKQCLGLLALSIDEKAAAAEACSLESGNVKTCLSKAGVNMDVSEAKIAKTGFCLNSTFDPNAGCIGFTGESVVPADASQNLTDVMRKAEVVKLAESLGLELDKDPNLWEKPKREFFFNAVARTDINASKYMAEFLGIPITAWENADKAAKICVKEHGNICFVSSVNPSSVGNLKDEDAEKINAIVQSRYQGFTPAPLDKVRIYATILANDPLSATEGRMEGLMRITKEELDQIIRTYRVYVDMGEYIKENTGAGKLMSEKSTEAIMDSAIGIVSTVVDPIPAAQFAVSGAKYVIVKKVWSKFVERVGPRAAKEAAERAVEAIAAGETRTAVQAQAVRTLTELADEVSGRELASQSVLGPEQLRALMESGAVEPAPVSPALTALAEAGADSEVQQIARKALKEAHIVSEEELNASRVVIFPADAHFVEPPVSTNPIRAVQDGINGLTEDAGRLLRREEPTAPVVEVAERAAEPRSNPVLARVAEGGEAEGAPLGAVADNLSGAEAKLLGEAPPPPNPVEEMWGKATDGAKSWLDDLAGSPCPVGVGLIPVAYAQGGGNPCIKEGLNEVANLSRDLQAGRKTPELQEFWRSIVRDTDGRFQQYQKVAYEGHYRGPQPDFNLTDPDVARYIKANLDARGEFLRGAEGGRIYGNEEQFKKWLVELHQKQAYKPGQMPGELFLGGYSTGHTPIINGDVRVLAEKYKDPYASFLRNGKVGDEFTLQLPGIRREGLPVDRRIEAMEIKHTYPSAPYQSDYRRVMQQKLQELESMGINVPMEQQVRKISEFYQHAINSRMFMEVNQSLYMNMVNGLLEQRGLKPISHGVLDFVAMRLQPDNFAKYFSDEVKRVQPGGSLVGIIPKPASPVQQVARGVQGALDRVGAGVARKEIPQAQSFTELGQILDQVGVIQGSGNKLFSPEQNKKIIMGLREGKIKLSDGADPLLAVTSTGDLRATVNRLLQAREIKDAESIDELIQIVRQKGKVGEYSAEDMIRGLEAIRDGRTGRVDPYEVVTRTDGLRDKVRELGGCPVKFGLIPVAYAQGPTPCPKGPLEALARNAGNVFKQAGDGIGNFIRGESEVGLKIPKGTSEKKIRDVEYTYQILKETHPNTRPEVFSTTGSSAVVYTDKNNPGVVYKVFNGYVGPSDNPLEKRISDIRYAELEAKKLQILSQEGLAPKLIEYVPPSLTDEENRLLRDPSFGVVRPENSAMQAVTLSPAREGGKEPIIVMGKIETDGRGAVKLDKNPAKKKAEIDRVVSTLERLQFYPADTELVVDKSGKLIFVDLGGMSPKPIFKGDSIAEEVEFKFNALLTKQLKEEQQRNIFQKVRDGIGDTVSGWVDNFKGIFRRGGKEEVVAPIPKVLEETSLYDPYEFRNSLATSVEQKLASIPQTPSAPHVDQLIAVELEAQAHLETIAKKGNGIYFPPSSDDKAQAIVDVIEKMPYPYVDGFIRREDGKIRAIREFLPNDPLLIGDFIDSIPRGYVIYPREIKPEEKLVRLYRGVVGFDPDLPQTAPILRDSGLTTQDLKDFYNGRITFPQLIDRSGGKSSIKRNALEIPAGSALSDYSDLNKLIAMHIGSMPGISDSTDIFVSTAPNPIEAYKYAKAHGGVVNNRGNADKGIMVLDVPASEALPLNDSEFIILGEINSEWIRGYIPINGIKEENLGTVLRELDKSVIQQDQVAAKVLAKPLETEIAPEPPKTILEQVGDTVGGWVDNFKGIFRREGKKVGFDHHEVNPKVLYRGTKEKLDVLTPAPVLDSEKHRFPQGIENVVFASQFKGDAVAYAIASRKDLGGFHLTPFWRNEEKGEIGWKLRLDFPESKLPKDEKIYIYKLDPENFSRNTEGEWYSTGRAKPIEIEEITIGGALGYFDEVKFLVNKKTPFEQVGDTIGGWVDNIKGIFRVVLQDTTDFKPQVTIFKDDIFYHGTTKPDLKIEKEFVGERPGDGSQTLGFGLYGTDIRSSAEVYSKIRQFDVSAQPQLVAFKAKGAKMYDLRGFPPAANNLPVDRNLAERWLEYIENVHIGKNPEDNLQKILFEGETEYIRELKKLIVSQEEIDLRDMLGTGKKIGKYGGSPPWMEDFPKFMQGEGYDGVIYNEGGEALRGGIKEVTTGKGVSYVFFNLEKVKQVSPKTLLEQAGDVFQNWFNAILNIGKKQSLSLEAAWA